MAKEATKKPKKDDIYRVTCPNIYIGGRKFYKNDSVQLSAADAKEILDGDKAAKRKPRIVK